VGRHEKNFGEARGIERDNAKRSNIFVMTSEKAKRPPRQWEEESDGREVGRAFMRVSQTKKERGGAVRRWESYFTV